MIVKLLRPFKLLWLLLSPETRQSTTAILRKTYHDHLGENLGVKSVSIGELVNADEVKITLDRFKVEHGNVTYTELLYLCMIVRAYLRSGENFLEIGTFDGNTISNVSLNVPEDSKCYTIDLPIKPLDVAENYLPGDKELVDSRAKLVLKHLGKSKIQQFYTDSALFDFSSVSFSGAFIDGAHHYEMVKKDTENVFRHIRRPGFVLWHDYYGYAGDVAKFIHELCSRFRIRRIAGTNICFLRLESQDEIW